MVGVGAVEEPVGADTTSPALAHRSAAIEKRAMTIGQLRALILNRRMISMSGGGRGMSLGRISILDEGKLQLICSSPLSLLNSCGKLFSSQKLQVLSHHLHSTPDSHPSHPSS